MRLRTKILLASILCTSLAEGRAAWALTTLDPPWGDVPIQATVAMYGGHQVVVWVRNSDGACFFQVIGGADSLSDDFVIHGSSGNDRLAVARSVVISGTTVPDLACNLPVLSPVYGGHFLDLDGRNGNDTISCDDQDTWLWGGGGNDYMWFSNPNGQLHGGDGNDTLITYDPYGSGEALYGEAGTDCLEDANAAAAVFDCGSNVWFAPDYSASGLTPVGAVGCEFRKATCER